MTAFLDGLVQRSDYVLGGKVELSVRVRPPIEIFPERLASYGHVAPVNELVLQQEGQNFLGANINACLATPATNALGIPPIL